MLLNKKGILTLYLLVFVIISMGLALFLISGEDYTGILVLGQHQSALLESYASSENDLFNYEQLIKNNFKNSILFLAINGGFINREEIGGYSIWQKGNENCYPSKLSLESNLENLLKNKSVIGSSFRSNVLFNSINSNYLQVFSGKHNTNVTFVFDGIYTYEDNLQFKKYISYLPYVEYTQTYDYSFEDFINKVEIMEEISNLCLENILCWDNETSNFNWIDYAVNDKVFKFDIVSKKVKDIFSEEDVLIKGAIDFEEYNVALQGPFC